MSYQTDRVDEDSFRKALRQWVSGVTVVASAYQGVQHGMTVSSFLSISLDPPLLLVSLQNGTRTLEMIKQSQVFSVNVLRQDQGYLSDRFAGRLAELENRFVGLETFTLITQSPFLSDTLAGFDCQLYALQTAGDHTLVIGKVVALHESEAQLPLIYYQRTYHALAPVIADENG